MLKAATDLLRTSSISEFSLEGVAKVAGVTRLTVSTNSDRDAASWKRFWMKLPRAADSSSFQKLLQCRILVTP